MTRASASLGLALIVGIGAGGIGLVHPAAEEKKKVFIPSKESLVQRQLDLQGRQVINIDRYALAPGVVGDRHYHTGPVFVYVLEGSFTVDETGKSRRTFKAGEVYEEPIGIPMQARNLSTTERTRVLVIQLTKEGEALMYKAD